MAERIILSRTDSIGDVILTLPMAGVLKQLVPDSEIIFLGRKYTKPVIDCCTHISRFLDWDEINGQEKKTQVEILNETKADTLIHVFPRKEIAFLTKKAGVKNRIGVARRWYHLPTCNDLPNYSRRKSDLHEAQLNLKLLRHFGYEKDILLNEISTYYGFSKTKPLAAQWQNLIDNSRFNLIIHPKSKGNAKEWGLDNFSQLIEMLPVEKFNIFISGTKEEGEMLKEKLPLEKENVTDLTGKLTLDELISFITKADGILAASTGPLHIAGALGKHAIGLYSPKKPIHPGRWAPIGQFARAVVFDENCTDCIAGKACNCIQQIQPERVKEILIKLI